MMSAPDLLDVPRAVSAVMVNIATRPLNLCIEIALRLQHEIGLLRY